ncbi:unnamed protein product [Lupinus luteus]|uniref:X8 domain-containing protein n=1 Tax=Lupinus luteus TaxID=3873 RepID=A0AAV1WSC3_LUPLU
MPRLVFYVLFLALYISHSSASYCLCKDGVDEDELQKALDYACGFGADCGPIQPNGPCYEPNTMKDHCNYAVNSYYQNMQSAGGTCDFAGAATTSPTPPSKVSSGCIYPSSPGGSGAGTTPPSFGTPTPPATTVPDASPLTPNPETIPDVFGTAPPTFKNGSSTIKISNADLLVLLYLAISWLAMNA